MVFGGAGRYYDRLFLNATLDERFRLQYPVYRFEFSPDGSPVRGQPAVKWDPTYSRPRPACRQLIAAGRTGNPEIYLLSNDTKPPYSNQWNLGIPPGARQVVGSVSYNGVRGYRGFTLVCAAQRHLLPRVRAGFGNVIISDPDDEKYWYDARLPHARPAVYAAVELGRQLRLDAREGRAERQRSVQPRSTRPPPSTPQHDAGHRSDIASWPPVSVGSAVGHALQRASLRRLRRRRPHSSTSRKGFCFGGLTAAPASIAAQTGRFADRNVDLRLEKDFRVCGSTTVGVIARSLQRLQLDATTAASTTSSRREQEPEPRQAELRRHCSHAGMQVGLIS